jgi:hypothetical protein
MKNKNNIFLSAMIMTAVLGLSACSDVKETMGIGRNSPDEFSVVQRAPLTLPPDYSLRPPGDTTDTPPAAASADQAKTALLGKEVTPAVAGNGEKTLLDKLGIANSEPDIRKKIDEDNGYIALKSQTVADKLVFWDDNTPSPDDAPSSVVDPAKEAARIKKNKEEGKPLSDGSVPVIEKKQSTLDKIF